MKSFFRSIIGRVLSNHVDLHVIDESIASQRQPYGQTMNQADGHFPKEKQL